MKDNRVVEILSELIQFRSIGVQDDGALNFISLLLSEFDEIHVDRDEAKSIFLSKKFGDGTHLCFAGNVGFEGTLDEDMFKPAIDGEFIHGSHEMKANLAAIICALEECKGFDGTLSLFVGSGEKTGATIEILEGLKERGNLPDFGIILTPTCDKILGDNIKIAGHGEIKGLLSIADKSNAAEIFIEKAREFSAFELGKNDEILKPSKIEITSINTKNEASALLPSKIEIGFDIKTSSNASEVMIREYVENLYEKCDLRLELLNLSSPFLTKSNSKIINSLQKSIGKISNIEANLSANEARSEAGCFASYGIEVAEFGIACKKMQNTDKIAVSELENLKLIFKDLIENFKEKI